MMESLMYFQDGGGGSSVVTTSTSAAMSASDLYHQKRGRQNKNFSDAGFNDHSLMAYTSSPFASSDDPLTDPLADEDDIRMQLIQKEKDLILAAELGKALLAKNEELNEANERMADEFSKRLEVRNWFPHYAYFIPLEP